MLIQLKRRVARDTNVDPLDVRQIKKALNRLGCYTPLEKPASPAFPAPKCSTR